MSYFEFLQEKQVVMDDWKIKGDFDEYIEGIVLGNRLRKALLWEESEYYAELQEDRIQNEFIFKLFQMVVIGGSINQYDDDAKIYLDVLKGIYKDLVTVAKDPETGEIRVHSHVFMIESIDGLDRLFPIPGHP